MDSSELAEMYCKRMGNWKLDWEVLGLFFDMLLERTELTQSNIKDMLDEALSEWDI